MRPVGEPWPRQVSLPGMQSYDAAVPRKPGIMASLPWCMGLCTSSSLPSKTHELMAKPLKALQAGMGPGQGGQCPPQRAEPNRALRGSLCMAPGCGRSACNVTIFLPVRAGSRVWGSWGLIVSEVVVGTQTWLPFTQTTCFQACTPQLQARCSSPSRPTPMRDGSLTLSSSGASLPSTGFAGRHSAAHQTGEAEGRDQAGP